MTRSNLERIIRAAGTIVDDSDTIVIGSQSALGQFPDAAPELLVSREADVHPRKRPERNDLIDGSIGEVSPFEREFGYCARGVDSTTAILPPGWENRLVPVSGENTRNVRGWCLEIHDLAVAKVVAGRPKNLEFVGWRIRRGYINAELLQTRPQTTTLDPRIAELAEARLKRLLAENG